MAIFILESSIYYIGSVGISHGNYFTGICGMERLGACFPYYIDRHSLPGAEIKKGHPLNAIWVWGVEGYMM